MSDSEFLNWVADRLVYKYNESENVDFVTKLREIAGKLGDKWPTTDTSEIAHYDKLPTPAAQPEKTWIEVMAHEIAMQILDWCDWPGESTEGKEAARLIMAFAATAAARAREQAARLEEAEWWAKRAGHTGPLHAKDLDTSCELCVRIVGLRKTVAALRAGEPKAQAEEGKC